MNVDFSSAGKDKQKSKEDQDHLENPTDFKDPSVEQKERLLATDEDITDEEDIEIAKALPTTSQVSPSLQCLRNLICTDETSKVLILPLFNGTSVHRRSDFCGFI